MGQPGSPAKPGDLLARSLVAVAALAVAGDEDAAGSPSVEVVVKGPDDGWGEGDAGGLAALAGDFEDAVAGGRRRPVGVDAESGQLRSWASVRTGM